MTKKHFERLLSLCLDVFEEDPDIYDRYCEGKFNRSERVVDLQMRFCFDICRLCYMKDTSLLTDLYGYLNDDHIYTALKIILPVVEKRY